MLLEYVVNSIKERDSTSHVLNVNSNNKARYFYETHGFTIMQEVNIDIGEGYFMNDYIMELNLKLIYPTYFIIFSIYSKYITGYLIFFNAD